MGHMLEHCMVDRLVLTLLVNNSVHRKARLSEISSEVEEEQCLGFLLVQ